MIDVKFKEFIKLNRGFDLPNDKMVFGEYPVVASTNIKGFHNNFKVKAPCVVTGRSGSLGTVQYIINDCVPLNTSLYVKDFKGNLPKYVYYYLKTMHLESFNSGAGVPTLNQNHLHNIKLKIHDYSTQQKVADILSAYDDLIENNNQRIDLLEKAAQNLYKEWFVRFRFPNHKQTKFEKGLPKGWEARRLSEIVNTQYGYTASAESDEVGPKFLRITDIAQEKLMWDNVPYCKIESKDILKYLIEPGDILVARTGATAGYAKRINKKSPEAVFASFLVRLKPLDKKLSLMIGMVVESEQYKGFIQAIATGAAQPQANAKLLTLFSMVVPDNSTIDMFNSIVEPMKDKLENLQNQNSNLIKQRDLLLPRLMSGNLEL